MDFNNIFQTSQKLEEVTKDQIVADQAALASARGNPEKGKPEGRTATQQTLAATQNFANKPSPTTATTTINQIVGEKNLMKHGPNLKTAAINMLSDAVDFEKVGLTSDPQTAASSKQDATEAIESPADANTTITDLNNDIQEDKASATNTQGATGEVPQSTGTPATTPNAISQTTPTEQPVASTDATTTEDQTDEKDEQETKKNLDELNKAVANSEMSEENKQKYAKLSQEATDIQNSLGDWIKKFKVDPSIKTLVNRYSGKEAKQQARDAKAQARAQAKLGESVEHMEEAKGGFMFHYKNFIKAAGKVRVWAVVGLALIATAVVGGIGFGVIRNIIKSTKAKDAIEKGLQNAGGDANLTGGEGGEPIVPTDQSEGGEPTVPTDQTTTETQTTTDQTTTDTTETQTTEETVETPEEVKEELVDKQVVDTPVDPLGGKTTREWVQEQKAAGKGVQQIVQEYETLGASKGWSRNGPKFIAAMVALFGGITIVSTTTNPTTREIIGTDASGKSYKIDTNTFTASAISEQQKAQEVAQIEQEITQKPEEAKEVAKEVAKEESGDSTGADSVETQDQTNQTSEQTPEQQAQEQKGATPDIPKIKQKGKAMSVGEWIIAQSKKNGHQYNTTNILAGIKRGGVVFTKHAGQYYWGPKDSAVYDENGKIKRFAQVSQSTVNYGESDVLAVKTEKGFVLNPNSPTAVHVVYLDNNNDSLIGCQKPTDTQFLLVKNGAGGFQPKSVDEIVGEICKSSDKSNNQNIAVAGIGATGYGALIGTAICPGVGTALGAMFGAFAGLLTGGVLGSIFSNAASFCKNISWESMTPTSKTQLINWSASHLNANTIGNGANEQEMQKLQNVAQQAANLMKQKVNYVGAPGESIQTALTNIRIEAVNQAKKALGA